VMEKHIAILSNDPLTPEVTLAIKLDFTPLYDLNPITLSPSLPFGSNDTTQFTVLTRTDGKPLKIVRMDSSKPWITATTEPAATSRLKPRWRASPALKCRSSSTCSSRERVAAGHLTGPCTLFFLARPGPDHGRARQPPLQEAGAQNMRHHSRFPRRHVRQGRC